MSKFYTKDHIVRPLSLRKSTLRGRLSERPELEEHRLKPTDFEPVTDYIDAPYTSDTLNHIREDIKNSIGTLAKYVTIEDITEPDDNEQILLAGSQERVPVHFYKISGPRIVIELVQGMGPDWFWKTRKSEADELAAENEIAIQLQEHIEKQREGFPR